MKSYKITFKYDDTFGNILSHYKRDETFNPYAFCAREVDHFDLFYFKARYYDPSIGRFLSQDPIGFSSGDYNFYRYVGNSPVTFIDPTGFARSVDTVESKALKKVVENQPVTPCPKVPSGNPNGAKCRYKDGCVIYGPCIEKKKNNETENKDLTAYFAKKVKKDNKESFEEIHEAYLGDAVYIVAKSSKKESATLKVIEDGTIINGTKDSDISFLKLTTSSDGKVTKEKESSFKINLDKKEKKMKKGEVYIQLSPKEEKTFSTINKKLYKDNNKSTTLYLKGDKKIDSSKLTLKAFVITKEMVNSVASGKGSDALLNALNKYAPIYEVNTPLRVAHFLAQVAHESGKFTSFKEGECYHHNSAYEIHNEYKKYYDKLQKDNAEIDKENIDIEIDNILFKGYEDYTKGENFKAKKKNKYFPDIKKCCKQPDFFNLVYKNENGNGDEKSGDGYKYRGRGVMQITGRTKYTAFTTHQNNKFPDNKKDFIINPDLVATDIEFAVLSAFYFWNELSARGGSVNKYAIGVKKEDVYNVSWCVNGRKKQTPPFMPPTSGHTIESNGLKDRWGKFEQIAKHMKLL